MAVSYLRKGTFRSTSTKPFALALLPASYADGDLMLLLVHTPGGTIATPSNWNLLSSQNFGTVDTAGAVTLSVFWKICSGTETSPSFTWSAYTAQAIILLFTGSDLTTPILTYTGRNQTSNTTTYTGNALTTTVDGCMIVDCIGLDNDGANTAMLSSWSNASLASITEAHDQTVATGAGGGVGGAYGIDSVAGSVNATTATLSNQMYACISLAIQPPIVITGQKLKYWSGSAWVEGTLKRYDGATWVDTVLKYWNGSNWV